MDTQSSANVSRDTLKDKKSSSQLELKQSYDPVVITGEEKPFHFLCVLFEGFVAGGTAGAVVETALYPIDTIKTRLQAGLLEEEEKLC